MKIHSTLFTKPFPRSSARLCGWIGAAVLALAPAAWAQTAVTYTNGLLVFTNYTWTCPANVYSLQVEAYGGGGASGNAGTANYECTGGGAGGSYVRYTVNVSPGTIYNLTVGAGGLTNANMSGSNNIPGNTGGSSFFGNTSAGTTNGALVCAVGGAGGLGTITAGTSSARVVGVPGGIASTNGNIPLISSQANFADYAGTSGGTSTGGGSANSFGGAGGAGAGPSGSAGGGAGGPALLGGGTSQAGTNGFAPGGGAGGAANATLKKTGGNGGAGRVVLTYSANVNVAGSSTVVASPTSVPADGSTTSTISVTLKDASANPLVGKTISLGSSLGGVTISPASTNTPPSGVVTFTVLSTVGGSATLTATDTTDSITITQTATVTFTTGVNIDHFSVIPSVSSTNAGQLFTATVQAYSTPGGGSPITDSSADGITVAMTSSGAAQFDANGDGTYGDYLKPLTNGTFTINVKDLKAESLTLTASLGTNTGTSASMSITPGALAQLQLLLPGETAAPGTVAGKTGAPTAQTAGSGFSVTVNAVDANWNVVSASDTVGLSAANDANAILPANTALSSGTATLSVTNILAGSQRTLTASDVSNGGITSNTSPTYSVVPGAVARMLILAPGESATLGVAPGKSGSPSAQHSTVGYSVTVDALDAYYNLATNSTDVVGVSSSVGGDTLPANASLLGGTKDFSVTNNTVGSATLTATNVTQGLAVAIGTSTVTVNINSTTTALSTSVNPANEGSQVTFTATVSGAGLKTGTVTFKNGTATLGTGTLSGNTATFTTSGGGAGTYSITALYSGDANNTGSTSSALSQVIQVGNGVASPAQMEDGFDYGLIGASPGMPIGNPVPGLGAWQCSSDLSLNTAVTGNILIVSNDLTSTTSPLLKPLPNQTTNVAAHLYVNKGATDRELLRSIGNAISSGSAYFSFLINTSNNPTTTGAPMVTMLASNVNNAPLGNDPVTLYGRLGADSTHYNLGIQRLGGTISWASASLADSTTYIVVMEYTFGGNCQLFLNPTPGNSQPVADAVATSGAVAEPANIGTILFYESGTPLPLSDGRFTYDVMRVDSNWYNVTPPFGSSGLGATKLAFTPASQIIQLNHNSALMTVNLLSQSNTTFTASSDLVVALSSSSGSGTFLSGADGTTVISSVTISNGTSGVTFYYKDSTPGSPTLTGANGLLTPAVQSEVVTPDLSRLGHFTVTPSLSSTTAGTVFTATVQAYDTNNVAVTDSSFDGAPVTMSSSGLAQFDANGDATYGDNFKGLVNGAFTINVRDTRVETVTLTAGLATNIATSTSISISAGSFARLEVLLPGETAAPGTATGRTGSPSVQTAGTGFNVTVKAVDAYWNGVSVTDTVHLTQSGDADVVLPADTALAGGTATLSLTNILAGSGQTLTASDVSNGGITADTSSAYAVVSGAATRLVLLAPGETPTFGVAPGKTGTPGDQLQTGSFTVTAYALDAYYNLAANNTDVVHFTSTDGAATLPANGALVGGTKSFTIKNNTQGSITDTASDISNGGVAAGSTSLTIDPVQSYRSVQSGNWDDTNTWQFSSDGVTWIPAVTTPSSALTAIVEITNGITVTVASSVSVNRTTVDVGGTLAVSPGVTLTVVSGSGADLDVFGALSNAGVITVVSPAITYIHNGATYYHNQDGGAIVTATWETNSTCAVTGWATTTSVSTTTGLKQTFGNFTWNSPSQTSTLSFGSSPPTTFKGNFNVISTGSGIVALCLGATVSLNVSGDVNVSGGTLYGATTGSGTETVNVGGNVNISSGTLNLEANPTGTEAVTWNLSGNVNITGGTLTAACTNTWPVINFVKSGIQHLTVSGSGQIASTCTIDWAVTNGTTLDLGTSVVHGVGTFDVIPGGGLITAHAAGFGGNILIPSFYVGLSQSANYTYDGASAQSGDTLLPATVAGLTINNSHGVTLNQAETVTNLNLNGSPLTGTVAMGSGGAFTVTGTGSKVVGNVTLNSSSLVLISSNNLPELLVQGGVLTLNSGGVALNLQGSALAQGSYLLVDADTGGSVAGPSKLVTVTGAGLPPGVAGTTKISSGKMYLSVYALFAGYDAGQGFFGGEDLQLTNTSGMNMQVWSSVNPGLPLASWNLEGAMSEQIYNDNSGTSLYSINVNPVVSPTYYVVGTTVAGPYTVSPVPVVVLTTANFTDFVVGQLTAGISGAGVLNVTPMFGTSGQVVGGGNFQLQFSGANGFGYTVWASTNLTSWSVIGGGTFGNTPVTFTDTAAPGQPTKFYRISTP